MADPPIVDRLDADERVTPVEQPPVGPAPLTGTAEGATRPSGSSVRCRADGDTDGDMDGSLIRTT
ncbi:hypothetical protein [Kitasatospora sp. NPDC088346]|uniref:hypothetical protein n=1 Tax=Kitasatospora sp. NPDC088346 TaxID=3364073 RepID=UPI00381E8450